VIDVTSAYLRFRITQENKLGQRVIGASDFIKNGIPASILATFVGHLSVWHAVSFAKVDGCRSPLLLGML